MRRIPTNTPLQALAVLNEEQSLECAKFLAVRASGSGNNGGAPQDAGASCHFTHTFGGRSADPPQAGLANLLVRYQAAPDDAVLLLKEGAREVPADLNPPELAARMLVASTVLNFDQTLVRH